MEIDNLLQLSTPIQTAFLYFQHERKRDVTKADLDSIEAAFPAATKGPLFAYHCARAEAGTLRRRPGRSRRTTAEYLRFWHARFEIEEEVERIWALRRTGALKRSRGDLEPCVQAAESVARRLKLPCGGRSLLSRLSKEGIH